ncbi:hypothetical protein OAP18_02580 [Gammaproteobacteria bacterium]|nr:hypothetical protein [Gammaproteobacteria bacterium]
MSALKRNFTWLILSLFAVVFLLIFLSVFLSKSVSAATSDQDFPVPVSINALMVTLIDHSAHYIWDYGVIEDNFNEEEWQAVQYYAVQLAAAGPLLTLGGTGEFDNAWVTSPSWIAYSRQMSAAAEQALMATRIQDKFLLREAGDNLVQSCEGCHNEFKSDIPTEGIFHDPQYDHLYHLFER